MTAPDPLREDEVAHMCMCDWSRRNGATIMCMACSGPMGAEAARAAILRLDQVRGK